MQTIDQQVKENSHEENVQFVIQRKQGGDSFTDIRMELQNQGLEAEYVSEIIKEADEQLLNGMIAASERKQLNWARPVGYLLILIGAGFSIAISFGFTPIKGVHVLWYGPILSGLGLMYYDNKRRVAERRRQRRGSKFRRP